MPYPNRLAALGSVALVLLLPACSQVSDAQQSDEQASARREHLMATTPDTRGSGPYPSIKLEEQSLPEHVVYRPANLGAVEEALPIVVFGNGGCRGDGASARLFLNEIASWGYLVIANGTIKSGPGVGTPDEPERDREAEGNPTSADDLIEAIDWAINENARPASPYYDKVDFDKVAVSGHSCGGLQALDASSDERVSTSLILNSGALNEDHDPPEGTVVVSSKAWLDEVHGPMLYLLGGPNDVAYENGMDDFRRLDHVPVLVANLDVGHGGTYWDPNGGEWARVATAWLNWHLRDDRAAAEMFVGTDCTLCQKDEWDIRKKNLDKLVSD